MTCDGNGIHITIFSQVAAAILHAHLRAAEEPDYALEAPMTSRNAVERPALTAIRRDMTRA
jgi:hypothetical protein